MEIFDIVDENGRPTGETVERKQAHRDGIRHRTAHVWVVRMRDNKAQVLLQKRSLNKDSFPGRLDTSSAGHIRAGFAPAESAVRELGEELGIFADAAELSYAGQFVNCYEAEFHGSIFRDNEISFVYVLTREVRDEDITVQAEELDSVEWHDYDEVVREVARHNRMFCVPTGGLEVLGAWLAKQSSL